LNFSANYYNPPQDYQAEVKNIWGEFLVKLPLKYSYSMSIVSDKECTGLKGIPEIGNRHVNMPDNMVKYTYQNYYKDRAKILNCIFAHEISHVEYNLYDMSTPQAHLQVDIKATEMLAGNTDITATDFYKSLFVLKNYWFSRKGLGGHLANVGWNIINVATLIYGGSGYFRDWFATDVNKRMSLYIRHYKLKDSSCFTRSQAPAA